MTQLFKLSKGFRQRSPHVLSQFITCTNLFPIQQQKLLAGEGIRHEIIGSAHIRSIDPLKFIGILNGLSCFFELFIFRRRYADILGKHLFRKNAGIIGKLGLILLPESFQHIPAKGGKALKHLSFPAESFKLRADPVQEPPENDIVLPVFPSGLLLCLLAHVGQFRIPGPEMIGHHPSEQQLFPFIPVFCKGRHQQCRIRIFLPHEPERGHRFFHVSGSLTGDHKRLAIQPLSDLLIRPSPVRIVFVIAVGDVIIGQS